MLQNQEFRASILVIAKTALSFGIAYVFNALEVEGARKSKSKKNQPFVPTAKDSQMAFSLYYNVINFPKTSSSKISAIEYTKLVGVEKIPTEVGKVDIFRNSILTELAVFHNRNLVIILDKCDFKSNPELTKYILSYQEANGLNLLNIDLFSKYHKFLITSEYYKCFNLKSKNNLFDLIRHFYRITDLEIFK
jgi:hypothetical protein